MWTYWRLKIDKKSDSMDAYWGSFLSVWGVSRIVREVSKVTCGEQGQQVANMIPEVF